MNNKKIGIDSISFYVPSLYLSIEDLANKREIPFEKLNKGLGLNKMAVADKNEDAASFAANALIALIEQNKINKTQTSSKGSRMCPPYSAASIWTLLT